MRTAELAKAIITELKQFVVDSVKGQMATLNERLDELLNRAPEKGEKGDVGPAGADGAAGKDAPAPATEALMLAIKDYCQTPEGLQLLRDLAPAPVPGEKGETGAAGADGKDGADAPGPTHEQVDKAIRKLFSTDQWNGNTEGPGLALLKEMVAELPKPEKGEKGDQGVPGADAPAPTEEHLNALIGKALEGKVKAAVEEAVKALPAPVDGKDAADIDILPSLPVDKSVSRGTYAMHNGGLWRSFQKTQGLKGWECIVDGIADIAVEQMGERGVEVTVLRSSGEPVSKSFELPVMIYREIFTEGETYAKGDCVTYGGSIWHCKADGVKSIPGANADEWRLAVKRGVNGRDGKNGEKGEKGDAGKDGKLRT